MRRNSVDAFKFTWESANNLPQIFESSSIRREVKRETSVYVSLAILTRSIVFYTVEQFRYVNHYRWMNVMCFLLRCAFRHSMDYKWHSNYVKITKNSDHVNKNFGVFKPSWASVIIALFIKKSQVHVISLLNKF